MKRTVACLIALVLIVCSLFAETLVVGLPEPGRMPFFWQTEKREYKGSYVELIRRIAELAGFEAEFKMIPQARLIAMFNAGQIDIEPGVAPSWRPSADEAMISLYSAPFMVMNDILIFPKGTVIPKIESMEDLRTLRGRVGQVRGFYLPPGVTIVECTDEYSIARLVDSAALDAGFINASVATWYLSTYRFGYVLSPPFASTPVSLRLRIERTKWLDPINAALGVLEKTGELKKIMNQ